MASEFNNLLEEELTSRSLSVGQIVDGTVVQINEEGVFVDIGAKSEGHLELDQILEDELRRLQIGDVLKVKIVRHSDGEFKLSKKSVDYDEAWNRLQDDFANAREVEVKVVEKVKNGYMCEAYGLVQGFCHHTNFKGRPSMDIGFKANILELNRKQRKLVFTRRDIVMREEQESLERDYGQLLEGMVVEGVVERLSPYGAFVKITNSITGLLHISEFSYEHVKKPSEVLKPGDVIPVKILSIDREKNKVSLSRKAAMKDPLMLLLPGEEVDGKVESVTDFGVFVRMDNGVTGLVHVSELSHNRFNHPSEVVKPGDDLRVKILRVQPEDRRVSLSARATERDPWTEVYGKYSQGQEFTGTVTQVLQSGLVVSLDSTFEAFIPVSEISEERIKHPKDVHTEGEEVSGVILSIDTAKRRIRGTLRRSAESVARESQPSYVGSSSSHEPQIHASAGKVTLGDILAGKLDLSQAAKRDKGPSLAEAAGIDMGGPSDQEPDAPPMLGASASLQDRDEDAAAGGDGGSATAGDVAGASDAGAADTADDASSGGADDDSSSVADASVSEAEPENAAGVSDAGAENSAEEATAATASPDDAAAGTVDESAGVGGDESATAEDAGTDAGETSGDETPEATEETADENLPQ
jgi:small subunit ribosomal protein S1